MERRHHRCNAVPSATRSMVVEMTATIDIWDWEREPHPPSARVVVCRPGTLNLLGGALEAARHIVESKKAHPGQTFVIPDSWTGYEHPMPGIVPALYAERQSDLDGVGALLAVQAERRAIVLCPREAMVLEEHGAGPWCLDVDTRARIDLVVIIPPPEARACGRCAGDGRVMHPITDRNSDGMMVDCAACNGSGRIEPWPLHPAWIRGIVEQCRSAGVPCLPLTEHGTIMGIGTVPPALPDWLT